MRKTATVAVRGQPAVRDFALVPGAVIQGQVVSAVTDAPVAGAVVTAVVGAQTERDSIDSRLSRTGAIADGQGQFTIRGLDSGPVALRAFAPGLSSAQPTTLEMAIAERVQGVVVAVDSAFSISGLVVEKGDRSRPVAGARIRASSVTRAGSYAAAQVSGKNGAFTIDGVQPGAYEILARSDDHVIALSGPKVRIIDADVADVANVIVELDRGATLAGRVEPAQKARIHLQPDGSMRAMRDWRYRARLATTATDSAESGEFRLSAAPSGTYDVVATGADGSEGRVRVTVDDTGGGNRDDLLIALEERGSIAGQVVDEDGQPVASVRVKAILDSDDEAPVSLSAWRRGPTALTGQDGTFTIVGLRPGTHELEVEDDVDVLAWSGETRRQARRSEVAVTIRGRAAVTGVTLVVESRNQRIAGVVRGPDGEPRADVWVTAARTSTGEDADHHNDDDKAGQSGRTSSSSRTAPLGGAARPVLTDADGRFTVEGLHKGIYRLRAESAKGTVRGQVLGIEAGRDDVEIRLQALSTLAGAVTDRGNPVARYVIAIDGPTPRRTQVANRDGRYRLGRLEPGSYRISVTAISGLASAEVAVGVAENVNQDLQIATFGTIRGRVVDASGAPLAGLQVLVESASRRGLHEFVTSIRMGTTIATDDRGQFQARRIEPGPGRVKLLDPAAKTQTVLAYCAFALAEGQDLDLGDIRGIGKDTVPEAERGHIGMFVAHGAWEYRPGAPMTGDIPPRDGLDARASS